MKNSYSVALVALFPLLRCIRTLEAHLESILCLAGSESSLYSGSADRSIRLWSCRRSGGTPRNLSHDSNNGAPSPSLPHSSSSNLPPRSPSVTHSSPSMTGSRHGSLGKLDTQVFSLDTTWEDHDEQVRFVGLVGCLAALFSGWEGSIRKLPTVTTVTLII